MDNNVGYKRRIIISNTRITGISEMRDSLFVITYKAYFLLGGTSLVLVHNPRPFIVYRLAVFRS